MKNPYLLFLLHYLCPVLIGLSIAEVVHRATGQPISAPGLCLFIAGICAAYSLDRLLGKDGAVQARWARRGLIVIFCLAAVVCVLSAIRVGDQLVAALVIFAVASLLYRKLKRYPLAKTLIVAIVWAWAGTVLSIQGGAAYEWGWWSLGFMLPMLLQLSVGCILCDLKDEKIDAERGIPSLPVLLGMRSTALVASGIALVAAVLACSEGRFGIGASCAALAVLGQFPRVVATPGSGPLLVDAMLALPGLLIYTHIVH